MEVTPTTQAITFAIIGAFVTLMTIVLSNRAKRLMAKQLHEQRVADRIAAQQKEERDFERQQEMQRKLDNSTSMTLTKLHDVENLGKVTHALVNSDKTATMKDQRDNMKLTLALMNEVVALRAEQGGTPTAQTLVAIDNLATQIATLDTSIADRLHAQAVAEEHNAIVDRSLPRTDSGEVLVVN